MPLPPLCWLLKLSGVMRLMYPRLVLAIITSSSGIKSSMDKSYSSNPICVLLSSAYLSAMALISVLMTVRSFFLSLKIALYSAIFASSSFNSASSFSLSRPVSARRRISTIACACASESPNSLISPSLAICTFCEPLIIWMTRSILSSAIIKPSKMWARSSALFKSYCVLLVTTSS